MGLERGTDGVSSRAMGVHCGCWDTAGVRLDKYSIVKYPLCTESAMKQIEVRRRRSMRQQRRQWIAAAMEADCWW